MMPYRKIRFSPRWSLDHPSSIRPVLQLHWVVSEKQNGNGWSIDHLGENRGFWILHPNIFQNGRPRKWRGSHRKSRFSPRWWIDHHNSLQTVFPTRTVVSEKLNEKGWSPEQTTQKLQLQQFTSLENRDYREITKWETDDAISKNQVFA